MIQKLFSQVKANGGLYVEISQVNAIVELATLNGVQLFGGTLSEDATKKYLYIDK
jgi:hypothetical protein